MSLLNLITGGKKVLFKIGSAVIMEIDATPSISHERSSYVTKFPIEDGSNVTDHVTLQNKRVNLECNITDTPTSFLSSVFSTALAGITNQITNNIGLTTVIPSLAGLALRDNERVDTNYKILNDLWQGRIPFKVIAGYDVYDNVVIQNLKVSQTPKTKGLLKFSIALEQITIVITETETITASNIASFARKSASERANLGEQIAEKASSAVETQAKSILLKIGESIGKTLTGG